jgi:hypothetical protein
MAAEDEKEPKRGGGLHVKELFIAGASSAVAFLVVPLFWESGTLFATAMTPVIVAIVRELLAKPVESVGQVSQRVRAVAPTPAVVVHRPRRGHRDRGQTTQVQEPPPPPSRGPGEDPFGLYEGERAKRRGSRALRIGLVTGLVAFVIVAVLATFTQVTIGGRSFGSDNKPTLTGGSAPGRSSTSEKRDSQDSKRQQQEEASPTPTATPSPGATPTPSPQGSATPTPSATPSPSATPTPPGAAPSATPAPATPTPGG